MKGVEFDGTIRNRLGSGRDGSVYNAIDCFHTPEQVSAVRLHLIPIILFSLSATFVVGQETVASSVPLVDTSEVSTQTAGQQLLTLQAARRAQEMGFSSSAVALYRELLDQSGANRGEIQLALVTALLDSGEIDEADEILAEFIGLKGAAWHLRSGLVAAQKRDFTRAQYELAAIVEDELTKDDRGWLLFFRGVLADESGDLEEAREFFAEAQGIATSPMAVARFDLAREQARLRLGAIDDKAIEEARKNMERLKGRKTSYGFVRIYATMLDATGNKDAAVDVLQRQLLNLPAEELSERDSFYLLLGLIAGAESESGRSALTSLLRTGRERGKQRVALQLLAGVAGDATARVSLARTLDAVLRQSSLTGILEDVLLVRAQVALAEHDYRRAEQESYRLLEQFPGSVLKASTYGVLAGSAWDQRRFRAAADFATKARAGLGASEDRQTRAELGVLIAEAWFRARDYPNAAEAYASVLNEVPDGVAPGDLMFQRVLSDIRAGRVDLALVELDQLSRDERFDVVNRWQAEWNLARALQTNGRMVDAYARVSDLLAQNNEGSGDLPLELRARMIWLQARLSLQAGEAKRTLQLVDALSDELPEISEALSGQISSLGSLLKAEAYFKLDRMESALELLQELRSEFPNSDAAIYSIIVEATYYVDQDQTVEAQRLYTKLADDFPDNADYAPFALFQAALQAERRGQDSNLVEANRLIEDLVTRYGASPLVFYARLKQGDLLRKLNQFPQAQLVYENLVNNYPNHVDVVLAQLALAECHNAQSLDDTNHAERAITLFEHLRDRVDAPIDVRVEAGFNLGYLMARQERWNRAEAVWWRDVVTMFLLDDKMASALGPKGRYWMTRTLLELGALYEQQAKLDEARDAWLLILKTGLPGASLAKDRLARFEPATP